MSYETVIGLEIHVQLGTVSKLFCADEAAFGGAPNTHVSAISLAHPGTLPRVNQKAVEYAVQLGLALGSEINQASTFDRKNYFYPDLPKGYQITQDRQPICVGGLIQLDQRTVRIHHIHLEEDAGKSIHDQDPSATWIDLNRAGVPLVEIVTEPDLRSGAETAALMEEIRRLVRWLGISDGNMEEGSLRCDVNISVRPQGAEQFGERCEIKNVNSMRFARKAIEFEAARQVALLEAGETVRRQTRGFDPATGETYPQREKEAAHDYRYFPEPDLPPVLISDQWLAQIQGQMPSLPAEVRARWMETYELPFYDADLLSQERGVAAWVDRLLDGATPAQAKLLANVTIHKILPWCADQQLSPDQCPVPLPSWKTYVQMIENGALSTSTAQQRLFPALMAQPTADPRTLAEALQLLQTSDEDLLEKMVSEVLSRFPDKVAEYKKGKKGLLGLFMGEVMKTAKGKADPKITERLLREKLEA